MDHLLSKESKAGWNIRSERCLKPGAGGQNLGIVEEEFRRGDQLCNRRIARHQEGRTVGRSGDWGLDTDLRKGWI